VQSNLAIRLSTAAVVSPLLLLLLYRGPAWGWYVLIAAASVIAALEVLGMTHPKDTVARWIGAATCLAVSAGIYFYTHDARVLLTLALGTTLLGTLLPVWRLGDINTAATRMMAGIAVPWYVGMLTCLALLRREEGEQGAGYVLMTLMFAWMADTGGYFLGRFAGKTPLYPALSPKKTREGFVGALLGAVVGALLAHFWYLPEIPLLHALGLALAAGALGQLGDLAESLLKRATAIKDSGTIVPGHGGMMDRIDALLIASVLVYGYCAWRG